METIEPFNRLDTHFTVHRVVRRGVWTIVKP